MFQRENFADHDGVGSTVSHAVETGLHTTGSTADTTDLADVPAIAGIRALGVAHVKAGCWTAPTGERLITALAGVTLWPDAIGIVADSHVGAITIGRAVQGFETVAAIECGIAKNSSNRVVSCPVDDLIAVFFFNVGQKINHPGSLVITPIPTAGAHFTAVGQLLVVAAGKVVHGDAVLLQVVGAAHAVGGFAHLLYRRHQQPNQNRDDRDSHQKLNQRESPNSSAHSDPAGKVAMHL